MSIAQQTSRIWRLNVIALWALIATLSLFAGLMLRDWTWQTTSPIRFQGDISNALNIGRETVMAATTVEQGKPLTLPDWPAVWESYLNRYDVEYNRIAARKVQPLNVEARYRFDYPPGRLLIASAWANHVIHEVPTGQTRPRGMGVRYADELVTPLRWTNIGHEIAAAIAMFFLVRRVFVIAGRKMWISELAAMLAGLLVWFNPALILDAHGWPQWEAWVLPYTLWAAYFAMIDCWLIAGLLIATGAMLKGQVLMFAPIFPLWAIFSFRFGGLLRFACGFFAAAALLMSPWLVRDSLPAIWVIGGTLAFAAFIVLIRQRRTRLGIVALCVLIGLIASPWIGITVRPAWVIAAGIVTFLAFAFYTLMPRRPIWMALIVSAVSVLLAIQLPAVIAEAIGRSPPEWLSIAMPRWTHTNQFAPDAGLLKLALGVLCVIGGVAIASKKRVALPATLAMFAALAFIAAVGFNGSFSWLHVGFQTERYPQLSMGRVANLPAILQRSFQLDVTTPVTLFGLLDAPVELSDFLKISATVGLVLCALALTIQLRRKDPNAVIAFAAAWTLLYALLPQMHERYLTWGAVVSAVLITRGVAGLLIHVVLTAMQFAMILFGMSTSHGRGESIEALRPWLNVFAGLQPEGGYITVTLAFVLLFWSFRRSVPKLPKPRKAIAPANLIRTPKPLPTGEPIISTADTSPASV